MKEDPMSPEQRNTLRVWTDNIHKLFTALITVGVIWLIATTSSNDKGYSNLVIKMEAGNQLFRQTLVEQQRQFQDLQKQHAVDITNILNRFNEVRALELRIASQHYTKIEVVDLVDRTTKPIMNALNDQTKQLNDIEKLLSKRR